MNGVFPDNYCSIFSDHANKKIGYNGMMLFVEIMRCIYDTFDNYLWMKAWISKKYIKESCCWDVINISHSDIST